MEYLGMPLTLFCSIHYMNKTFDFFISYHHFYTPIHPPPPKKKKNYTCDSALENVKTFFFLHSKPDKIVESQEVQFLEMFLKKNDQN